MKQVIEVAVERPRASAALQTSGSKGRQSRGVTKFLAAFQCCSSFPI
jgi:hypothetical protein